MNTFSIVQGTPAVEYPCSYLDDALLLSPAEREMFIEINPGHMPTLARTWMAGSQLTALPAGVRTGTTAVAIRVGGQAGVAPADSTITTEAVFYLVKASIVQSGLTDDTTLYECLWATRQRWWMWKMAGEEYNTLTPDKTAYLTLTATDSSTPYTVQEIVDSIESLAISEEFGAVPAALVPPNNFNVTHTPVSDAIARLFRPLGWQLQYSPWTDAFKIIAFDYTDATELLSIAMYAGIMEEGSVNANDVTPATMAPKAARVLFPIWPYAPVDVAGLDHYLSSPQSNPIATGHAFTNEHLIVGDRFSFTYGTPTYSQNLTTLAAEIATRYFARANIAQDTYVLNGHYSAFLPGKQIRRVRISGDVDGTRTTVQFHGLYDLTREDHHLKFDIGGLVKAPHFPEHGDTSAMQVLPRHDGSVDFNAAQAAASSSRSDYLVNDNFLVWQRGESIDAATFFDNNSREFGPDQWRIESDGNDVVDLDFSRETEVGNATGVCTFTVATANKKFGLSQAIESQRLGGAEGNFLTFSFYAKKTGTTIGHLRAAILGYSGCPEAIDLTDDVPIVSVWNAAGADPTLGWAWTMLSPADTDLADLTADWQRFSVTTTAAVTSDYQNIAVFIWTDDTAIDASDTLLVKMAQLETGASPTAFVWRGIDYDLAQCKRYGQKTFDQGISPQYALGSDEASLLAYGVTGDVWGIQWQLPVTLWRVPTVSDVATYSPISNDATARNMTAGADTAVVTTQYADSRLTFKGGAAGDAGDEIKLHASVFVRL